LITQGALDLSPFLSDEEFVGLRRLGKEVTYAKYEGEGHGIEGYANKTDYWNRLIAWFDQHLKSSSEPTR
jgi:dipeptidyl aminopeptidase/acylaminoacyl peptidase